VKWPDYAGREVSGPDLLRRTIIYKVGHHASHNATLMQGGLETMTRLRLALVPTDLEMAKKVGWGTLPWPSLLKRLATVTGDRVLRSDTGASVGLGSGVSLPSGFTLESPAAAGKQDLYFDITYTPSVATTGPAPGPAPAR
jgi:hypothetical protein